MKSAEHGAIEWQAVFIQDYSECLNERQVSVIGILYPDFENCFGNYQLLKDYWRRS